MTNGVLQATDVVKSYNKKEVLHSVSLTIEPGKIYGLIGRNGAGKTTLLSILTAQNTHDSGLVTYNGERVWENQKALDEICFSRELSPMLLFGQNTLKVKEYLRAAALYYPHWDKEYAARLIEMFGLDTKKKIYKLSKGMMSMVTIVLALASRAPITILDEPVAGLDVVAREQFYDVLLADYAETGRTFIISTHIIEEAADVLEEVIILHEGKILLRILFLSTTAVSSRQATAKASWPSSTMFLAGTRTWPAPAPGCRSSTKRAWAAAARPACAAAWIRCAAAQTGWMWISAA